MTLEQTERALRYLAALYGLRSITLQQLHVEIVHARLLAPYDRLSARRNSILISCDLI